MTENMLPEALVGAFDPDGDGGPTLIGSRCSACSSEHFPPKPACPDCSSGAVEPFPLPRTGSLHSWTTVRIPAPGIDAPFLLGEVDLPNDLRLVGRLEPGEYEIGQHVHVAAGIVRVHDGVPVLGYFFRGLD